MSPQSILISILLFINILLSNSVFAQNTSDIQLIKEQDFKDNSFTSKRKISFLFTKNKNVLLRYNPISLSFGGMMYFYQKFLSPQIGASCPYEISCSAFSKQCIQRYGFIKGVALSADRLMRCTRLASADLKLSDISEETHAIIDPPSSYKSSKSADAGR